MEIGNWISFNIRLSFSFSVLRILISCCAVLPVSQILFFFFSPRSAHLSHTFFLKFPILLVNSFSIFLMKYSQSLMKSFSNEKERERKKEKERNRTKNYTINEKESIYCPSSTQYKYTIVLLYIDIWRKNQ